MMLILPTMALSVGDRSGGDAEITYELSGAGGASFATNAAGTIKLGGSTGQGGLFVITTNADAVCQGGFWKAEGACTLYAPTITNLDRSASQMGVTFMVVNSNQYEVLYVTDSDGGLMAGQHAFTNSVTVLTGQGLAGSSTTVWDNAVSDDHRYYLIRCRE
jgi:hypothetical protein